MWLKYGTSFLLIYLVVHLLAVSTACSGSVSIEMDERVPPTFTFKRNYDEVDYIPMFYVSEVDPENLAIPSSQQTKEDKIIWQIEPLTGRDGEIKQLSPITYGIIPPRFTQTIPATGPPTKLVEGKTYEAGGPGTMVPKGFLRFTIREGKAIRVPVPGQKVQ